MTNRRQFIMTIVPAAAVLSGVTCAHAQAAKVDEKDPAAVGLAYKHDATKVDAKKHPNWKAGNTCGNCQFYQGKEAWGVCPLLGGKQVAAKGWCTAWAKKA
jgi:High potential iron-sulfur protein